jgi:hypothetical protein
MSPDFGDLFRRVPPLQPVDSTLIQATRPELTDVHPPVHLPIETAEGAGARQIPVSQTIPANREVSISPVLLRILRDGPVVADETADYFSSRNNPTVRWYFPVFTVKPPAVNSFTLNCRQYGIDSHAHPIYNGEAIIVVSKGVPPAIASLQASGDGFTYQEIPLNRVSLAFIVTLFDKSTLAYPAQLVAAGGDFTLTIKLETQDSLASFFGFVSNPDNRRYCSIQVTANYFCYIPKFNPPQLSVLQANFLNRHVDAVQTVSHPPGRNLALAVGLGSQIGSALGLRIPVDIPIVNSDDNYETREAYPWTFKINNVNFDCVEYPNNYLADTGVDHAMVAFGCRTPFGDTNATRKTYSHFVLSRGSLNDRDYGIRAIYRNSYNGNYLIIPQRYVIALDHTEDDQMLRPSAYLFTSIDVNDANGINNSTATFQFNVAPDISSYQLLLIKKLISTNIPASSNKTVDDIYVDFPQSPHAAQGLVFDPVRLPTVLISPMGAYPTGPSGSNYFRLQFQGVTIGNGNAQWVASQLKVPGGELTATISFDVDSDDEPSAQSTVVLSLLRLSGNAVRFESGGTSGPVLLNRTLCDVVLDAIQAPASDEQVLAAPVRLGPNGVADSSVLPFPVDSTPPVLRYTLLGTSAYLSMVLNEIRVVNLDTISDVIIVTNNTGLFSLFKIASIDFVISIIEPGQTDPEKALATASKSLIVDGAVNNIPFVLPVIKYLAKRSAVYSTVINFQDGTQQMNPVQYIDDLNQIGKLVNLTVSRLNLKKS